ncbi:CAP domain-containing protein [Streptomyces sp. NPDC007971]|uniref:CAP domain-containing protein n=1 Tax=Streptomyces sp. NPDC007971 TaxID=3364799 RepID=UPI0036E439BE
MTKSRPGRIARGAAILSAALISGLFGLTGPSQAQTGSQFTDAERNAVLARHNQERQAVGVPPLVWSNQLAADAQAWAALGTGGHSDPNKGQRPADQGESLYEAWGTPMPARNSIAGDAAAWWASEKQYYNADPNKKIDPAHAVNDPDPAKRTNLYRWGHYTQMVWSSTKEIGCGIKQGAPKSNGWFVVCRYRSAGNIAGQTPYPPGQAPPPAERMATVVGEDVDVYNVKNEPDGAGRVIGILRVGQQVKLVGSCQLESWCQVAGGNVPGGNGWVWGHLQFGQAPPPAERMATVAGEDVDVYNVKNEPDGAGRVIGILRVGQQVKLVGSCQLESWCQVAGDNVPGGNGWVWGHLQF